MARTRSDDRDELSELRDLLGVLREGGVVRYTKEGAKVEFVMGPPPSKSKDTQVKKDPLAARRAHYEALLNRPVGDDELEQLP